jgi:ATP-dependent Lhr-like helicase
VDDALQWFHPAVASWFRRQLGEPTPAQRLGWPAIASGKHCLIVAPTGSGKTLAAFLAALDHLWRTSRPNRGVRVLYISPLKALNQDIWRNLQSPLEGILAESHALGDPLPALRVAVRSGDTPSAERAAMIRKPPELLITTPESLHLLLTSRAREMLRGVSHVIVDEIHSVCGNKRGVFLALLLERLQAINPAGFVRIGLSATQRPLDEVARYLGGIARGGAPASGCRAEPRPVTIVDAGWRRDLDLQVIWPRSLDGSSLPGTIWPEIEHRVLALVRDHRSTIIFANNRRTVEKLTARLNALADPDEADELEAARPSASETDEGGENEPGGDDAGTAGSTGSARMFLAHHGSISLEERRATEAALKAGTAAAVVATASLELGIDMGAVDLVCQIESPGSVSRGLQRVGRAGHVVRGVSKGRLIAKTPGDLLESAALCRAMLQGEIERLRVPHGCLDVLAQQVVACVAMEPWDVPALFDLVRSAYPFHGLSADSFESVLRLVSGRFPTPELRDLSARVAWDRIHNRLAALPGTRHHATVGGGTIPDTGQFPVYLGDGGPRLGELDEEFVYERRVGETFALGNSTWRIEAIEPHRVLVGKAEGASAVMPFWRGESAPRTAELGAAVAVLSREIAERLDDPALFPWLERECRLGPSAARSLAQYIARQKRLAGAVPDDRTILIETFRDPAGELGLAVLTPFGGKLHHALKLALAGRIRHRFGFSPACLHSDDGLLFRLPNMDEPPLDLFEDFSAELAERLIREELPETALFGLRFRQNAARALLMPRPDPAKRTPLWLQRLRAKDLLQVARRFPDFPIVVETVRECLDDDLDLPRFRSLLEEVTTGKIRVERRRGEIPSPFTSELIFLFTAAHLYEWDEPKRSDREPISAVVDLDLLEPLLRGGSLDDWLLPQAVSRVESRLRRLGRPPRSADEMAERLRRLGDLTPSEVSGPMDAMLEELCLSGRALRMDLPGTSEPARWISAEEAASYRSAFLSATGANQEARESIVRRFLETHALIGLAELTARYPIPALDAAELLERWCEAGKVVRLGNPDLPGETRWAERENLAEIRRVTVAVRRRESLAVLPEVFAHYLLRRQLVHPATRGAGPASVELVLERLQGFAASASAWETEILPRRVRDYQPRWLDDVLARGAWLWRAIGTGDAEPSVAFFLRDFPGPVAGAADLPELSSLEQQVLEFLERHGASFATDVARIAGIDPSQVRRALRELTGRGLVTNDRFDPLRDGSDPTLDALAAASVSRRAGLSLRARPRRAARAVPEGRWWRIAAAGDDAEARLLAWAGVLSERYGVLTREVVALEPSAPSWGDLAPLLARAEWRGDIRRGYYVEGLSGVQYATEEAAAELPRLAALQPAAMALPSEQSFDTGGTRPPEADSAGGQRAQDTATADPARFVLVGTTDPANIYGAGAPLDIELLEGGVARLPRLPGNFLVQSDGRPVLIIEAYGKRLTALPWAARSDIKSALSFLVSLTGPTRRILKVETYNGAPAAQSPAAAWLLELGFVRDYPALAYYAGWPAASAGSQDARAT